MTARPAHPFARGCRRSRQRANRHCQDSEKSARAYHICRPRRAYRGLALCRRGEGSRDVGCGRADLRKRPAAARASNPATDGTIARARTHGLDESPGSARLACIRASRKLTQRPLQNAATPSRPANRTTPGRRKSGWTPVRASTRSGSASLSAIRSSAQSTSRMCSDARTAVCAGGHRCLRERRPGRRQVR
jgi:hypothetical protein